MHSYWTLKETYKHLKKEEEKTLMCLEAPESQKSTDFCAATFLAQNISARARKLRDFFFIIIIFSAFLFSVKSALITTSHIIYKKKQT